MGKVGKPALQSFIDICFVDDLSVIGLLINIFDLSPKYGMTAYQVKK